MTGVDGILGMAFDTSSIFAALNETWGQEAAKTLGASPITSFFAKDPSTPNNFDAQLGRVTTDTPDGGADGAFYVSRHAPGFELVEINGEFFCQSIGDPVCPGVSRDYVDPVVCTSTVLRSSH